MIDLSHETETLARRVAGAQRVTVDAAIRQALEASAAAAGIPVEQARDGSADAIAARRARIVRLMAEFAAMPVLDPRAPQQIMDDLNAI